MKKTILLISLLIISSLSLYPQTVEPPEMFLSYPIEDSDITYIDEIKNGILTLSKDDHFTVKGQISPKTVKQEWFLNQHWLIPQDESIICKNSAVSKSWVLDVTPAELDIWDYNRLYFEWNQAHTLIDPALHISLDIDSDENGAADIHLESNYPAPELDLTLKQEIDMDKEAYAPKSNLYLIRRELGLKGDATWRYVDHLDTQAGNQVVFQRRLDMPLQGIDQLKIAFLPGTDFRMVVFSISTVGKSKRDRFLLYSEMTHRREKKGTLEVDVIDIKDTLTRLGIDQSKAILIEPIIYIGGQTSTFLNEKKVKSLSFYSYTQPKTTGSSEMEPIVQKTPTGCSLDFDLEKEFDKREVWSGKIMGVTVEAELNSPQIITWKKAWLADRQEMESPTILLEPKTKLANFISNPSFIEKNQVLTGFTPLFGKKISSLPVSSPDPTDKPYLSTPTDDKDLTIEVRDAFYKVTKEENSLKVFGFFVSNVTPYIQICLKKDWQEQRYHLDVNSLVLGLVENWNTDKGIILNPLWLNERSFDFVVSTTQDTFLVFCPESQFRETRSDWDTQIIHWEIQLIKSTEKPFRDIQPIVSTLQPTWKCPTGIQGKPVIGFTGLETVPIPVDIGIDYITDSTEAKQIEYTVSKEKPNFILDIPIGSRIQDVFLKNPPADIPVQLDCVVVDALIEEYSESFDLGKLYWSNKEITIPLTSVSEHSSYDPKPKKFFLWSEPPKRTWEFSLSSDYIRPVSLDIKSIPDRKISYVIQHNGKRIPFLANSTVFDFTPYPEIQTDWSLIISYSGDKKLLVIDPPELTVFGVKKTSKECLDDLKIKLDDAYIATQNIQFPTEDSDWQSWGTIDIPSGQHTLEIEDSDFFHLDSFLLETQTGYPLPEPDEVSSTNQSSIISILSKMGIKFGIFAGFLALLYYFRKTIRYCLGLVFHPIGASINRVYWFIPEDGLFILWTLAGGGLYGIGLILLPPTNTENYFYTFGGIALVFAFWHFSHLIRNGLFRTLPKLAFYVYRGPGTPFISGFIVLLVWIATLVSVKLEPAAEQLAVIGYYFLVVGVIAEFLEARRNGWDDDEESDEPVSHKEE